MMTSSRTFYNSLIGLLMLIAGWPGISPVHAQQSATVSSEDGTEITYRRHGGEGEVLFIWFPSEDGLQEAERRAARRLADSGHENWLVDLFESRFLPTTASSLDKIPASDVVALIEAADPGQKRVFLISSGRGALPVLRGLHAWQLQNPDNDHTPGVILISPQFYHETPDPGEAAQLRPIVRQSNASIFILQPAKSPWRWKLGQTVPALEESGSDVFFRLLPAARDRFYYRPDATEREQQWETGLVHLVRQAALALHHWPAISRRVNPLEEELKPLSSSKKERELKAYAGDPQPPSLRLSGLDDREYTLEDYRGDVVLVNFWASWCPPCVHEMPSMERLQNRLQDRPFTILAVNMAEDKPTIRDFLDNKVNVTFPILLDRDGKALKQWEVFAFPTSYVIDKQGSIRYALFGSVDWERPDILDKIEKLINE
ncbi:TlpA disulfide reductase family protein [Thiohalophilus sp.]|uniref:TlpA family protein disulfide reductase n=1 Tax=Thiohalophilus sp. TaxID=3028392 RepID=UPI002ACD5C0B|nr:TlpA disulfide reductase family protein [Thiohalophilus sp.]MDZ7661375.1 TlpA disulfide reductase family protein [Thiohalophilus sp.]